MPSSPRAARCRRTLAEEPAPILREEFFQREDDSDDAFFYREPRLVTHIDDEAIAAVTAFYRQIIPDGALVLDLMTSWVSHLPAGKPLAGVAGLGMNRVELENNPVLTERVVQDLNKDPALSWDDATFDAAIVTVSVQYLVRPREVFAEVGRVLKPGAPFAVAYSNRCFPTKAVAIWQSLGPREHAELIGLYFRLAGTFEAAQAYNISPGPGHDPMYVVVGRKSAG
ncbi:MAG: methyltransferase domain-containing protein [Dehalococcoidia bacterium]|nr:methyltransferase domain-containing protein [Dehalococcoidia bacterium]